MWEWVCGAGHKVSARLVKAWRDDASVGTAFCRQCLRDVKVTRRKKK